MAYIIITFKLSNTYHGQHAPPLTYPGLSDSKGNMIFNYSALHTTLDGLYGQVYFAIALERNTSSKTVFMRTKLANRGNMEYD